MSQALFAPQGCFLATNSRSYWFRHFSASTAWLRPCFPPSTERKKGRGARQDFRAGLTEPGGGLSFEARVAAGAAEKGASRAEAEAERWVLIRDLHAQGREERESACRYDSVTG